MATQTQKKTNQADTPSPEEGTIRIEIPPLKIRVMEITIVGDTPLICHRWSEKAKKMMLAKQMGEAQDKKDKKSPEEDYKASLYRHPKGGFGFPVMAFKSAAVEACRYVSGIAMTEARGAFHIMGELVKIEGEPEPREDMVRLASGVADIRYRGQFPQWRATLRVRYNASALTPSQIVHLFNTAGFGVGVGEWRPASPKSKSGSFGMFHVETQNEEVTN